MPASNLESYKLEVEEALQAKLRILEAIRAQRQRRAVSRNEEPKGTGRWLLLYRPESFDGLVIQLVYYITAFAALDSAVLVVVDFADLDSAVPALLALLVVILLCVAAALYARSISLRMKSVGNAIRLGTIRSPNSDLGWLRRNLLIFKRRDGLWGLRFWYYVLLFLGVFGPFIQRQKRHYPWPEEVLIDCILFNVRAGC